MLQFSLPPPLSLYVHIPWCVRKCPYCDFNSHAAAEALPEAGYVEALLADLEQDLPVVWGRSVQSIFIGGGTPSLFSAEAMDTLLSGLRAHLRLLGGAEITLEANPGTAEAGRFAEYRHAGINRLSLGIQSFQDVQLQALGRIHGREEAIAAVEMAHAAGFDNINLDLMFGLPGQTPALARADVAQALALAPTHLSYYQLTLEPNTAFHHQPPELPEDGIIESIQHQGQELMAAAGFRQYEVSAYARADRQCRHNLNYWQFGDYLGIGAGAHGKLTHAAEGRVERLTKWRQPVDYLAAENRISTRQDIARQDLPFEFMLNALRLAEGFSSHLFSERTGLPISCIAGILQHAEQQGLLHWDVERIAPTVHGWNFLNDLMAMFLPEPGRG